MNIPHRCPICLGHGNVPGGFYNCTPGGTPTSTNTSEKCKACVNGVIYVDDALVSPTDIGVYPPPKQAFSHINQEIVQLLREILEEIKKYE